MTTARQASGCTCVWCNGRCKQKRGVSSRSCRINSKRGCRNRPRTTNSCFLEARTTGGGKSLAIEKNREISCFAVVVLGNSGECGSHDASRMREVNVNNRVAPHRQVGLWFTNAKIVDPVGHPRLPEPAISCPRIIILACPDTGRMVARMSQGCEVGLRQGTQNRVPAGPSQHAQDQVSLTVREALTGMVGLNVGKSDILPVEFPKKTEF